MGLPYWSEDDLKDRIGAEVALVCLDDGNTGSIPAGPLDRLQKDCDSRVEGWLRGIYDLEAVRANPPNQVVRLSLDAAEVSLAKRCPEFPRRDWFDMDVALERELGKIRRGEIRLDVVSTPEPGANEGGTLLAPGTDTTAGLVCAPPLVFGGPCGMGDF